MAFNTLTVTKNPLLQALIGDNILYPEALKIFYQIKRVVLKVHHARSIGRPLPTSQKALEYVRNSSIKHIAFHSETASTHALEGAELFKLMPKVDDLRYAHLGAATSPVGPVKMMVEIFSLNSLRLKLPSYSSSTNKLERSKPVSG
jgi:hypothetical protein